MVMPNFPFVFPLKSPLNVNDPVSVSPPAKQGESVVKLKFEMLSDPSALVVIEVPNWKAVLLSPPTKVAFQVPSRFCEFELFEPQPSRIRPITNSTAIPNCLIKNSPGVKSEGAPKLDAENGA